MAECKRLTWLSTDEERSSGPVRCGRERGASAQAGGDGRGSGAHLRHMREEADLGGQRAGEFVVGVVAAARRGEWLSKATEPCLGRHGSAPVAVRKWERPWGRAYIVVPAKVPSHIF